MVLDCAEPVALAEFWSAALGYVNVGAAGSYVALLAPDGVGPKLLLQRVGESKTVKNRMHLDIQADDIQAEARRLEGLGARRVGTDTATELGCSWVLMADPEGNEFCVCDGGAATPC